MLQAEKEKEAAMKAAMERAAADYHRETEQLAAQKAETEAMLAEKVRRSRMKARRKEEAVEPAPKVHLSSDLIAPSILLKCPVLKTMIDHQGVPLASCRITGASLLSFSIMLASHLVGMLA